MKRKKEKNFSAKKKVHNEKGTALQTGNPSDRKGLARSARKVTLLLNTKITVWVVRVRQRDSGHKR